MARRAAGPSPRLISKEAPLDLSLVSDAPGRAADLDAQCLPGGTLRLRGAGAVAALPGYAAGTWWVQDAAAALPVRLLGPVAGKRVLEIGAAPGGKTAQLAAAGARVTAARPRRAAHRPSAGESRAAPP